MKEIPLTNGGYTVVDDEDYPFLSTIPWYGVYMRNNIRYARRVMSLGDGKTLTVYMHRLIMEAPPHLVVDHRDWDGLNNQKSNLVVVKNVKNLHRGRPWLRFNKVCSHTFVK